MTPPNIEAYLDVDHLQILKPFVRTALGKPQQTAICVEPHPDGGVISVATDGYAMLAMHAPGAYTSHRMLVEPIEGTHRSKSYKMLGKTDRLVLCIDGRDGRVLRDDGYDPDMTLSDILMDGSEYLKISKAVRPLTEQFPEWRKAFAMGVDKPVVASYLGCPFLARFAEAARRFGKNLGRDAASIHVTSGGPKTPTVIRFEPGIRAIGLLMPIDSPAPTDDMLAWAIPIAADDI